MHGVSARPGDTLAKDQEGAFEGLRGGGALLAEPSAVHQPEGGKRAARAMPPARTTVEEITDAARYSNSPWCMISIGCQKGNYVLNLVAAISVPGEVRARAG